MRVFKTKPTGRPRVLTDEQRAANRKAHAHRMYLRKKERMTEEDRERRRERDRQRYALHGKKPQTEEQKKRESEAQRARLAAESPEKRAARLAKKREYNKTYVMSEWQREQLKKRSKEWYEANRARARERMREWAINNRRRSRIYSSNRRAKTRGRDAAVSQDIGQRLFSIQRGRCAACRALFDYSQMELDHIVPLSSGGEHADKNMQLLCVTCNRSKGAKDPVRFFQECGFLL